MIIEQTVRYKDGVCMRCTDQNCRRTESAREWSFFQPTTLSLLTQMRLVVAFAADTSVKSASLEYGVSRSTATNFYDNIRGRWSDDKLTSVC